MRKVYFIMKKSKRRHGYLIILIFLILLILYQTIFGKRGIIQLRRMKRNLEAIKASAERIKRENESLKKEIKLLQTDEKYIGKIAREKLGLVQEGEVIYIKREMTTY